MASAAESEVGVPFQNWQTSVPLRINFKELGFIQPQTPNQRI